MTTWGELKALAVAPLEHARGRERARPGRISKRVCASKKRYPSPASARATATELAADGGRRMHPYRCPVCHLWHLTKRGRT